MTSRDFCYWLQGFLELSDQADLESDGLRPHQLAKVQNHLGMVFKHEIDPSFGDKAKLDELRKIHEGALKTPPWEGKLNC